MFGRCKRILAVVWLAALAVPVFGQILPLRCDVRTLKGNWGFTCTGMAPNPLTITQSNPSPSIQPFAMNGTFSSDGKGQVRGPGWADFSGTIVEQYASTLSTDPMVVNPDCTGKVHYVMSLGGPGGEPAGEMDFKIVLLNENDGLGMPTSPGMTVTCNVTRLRSKD